MDGQFSRQLLYELVWSEPRVRLAKRLGISDTGLAKACIRAGIPMPARGYWARLAAGKPAARPALPCRGLGQSDVVQFGRPDFRILTGNEPVLVPPEPRFEETVETVRARAQEILLCCKVPKGLQNPHRLIAELIAEDDARRTEAGKNRFSWQQPRFDSRFGQRLLRITNALFTVMTHAGCAASVSSRELDRIGFQIGDTFVAIEITRPKAPRHAGKRDRTMLDDSITFTAVPWPSVSGVPAAWSDNESGLLETRITEVACDLMVVGELAYRASVRQHYEWCLERWQKMEADIRETRERTEREERERRQRREAEWREWLLGKAADRRRAEDIRALVRAADARHLDSTEASDAGVYGRWRSQALMQADQLDLCMAPLDTFIGPATEEPAEPDSEGDCMAGPAF
jgi:hypothetical protein